MSLTMFDVGNSSPCTCGGCNCAAVWNALLSSQFVVCTHSILGTKTLGYSGGYLANHSWAYNYPGYCGCGADSSYHISTVELTPPATCALGLQWLVNGSGCPAMGSPSPYFYWSATAGNCTVTCDPAVPTITFANCQVGAACATDLEKLLGIATPATFSCTITGYS